ncbi:MAG: Gfo/Idh/MocA family oxidoreductase [Candidatus Hydrogenedentes bacterium]|nr:Gfo/Idh/MocA family oxidoreductase [Candidatus Hydrogenedentota bacterium]
MDISRRSFLGASAAVVAGTMVRGAAFGANAKIGVCCIGINGRGGSHIKAFSESEASEVVALCDVDKKVLEKAGAALAEKTGKKPKLYVDMREAFADKSIDAVSIATPNHWHSLATVWACQAGKDVYVEKPMAHSFWEGQQCVNAAKKFKRIVQHGTQQRSDPKRIRDMQLLHEGKLIGPVVHARGYVYKNGNRVDIGKGKPGKAPESLDYNLWLGPAKERPWMAREGGDPGLPKDGGLFVHYNWHWFWDFGNGESGNQGVHEMDVAAWAANKGLPVRVSSTGGRYKWKDDGETPNTQAMHFTYADGTMLTFEVRNLGSFPEGGDDDCANSAFGTDGYWVKGKGFFDYKRKPIPVPDSAALPPSKGPFENFLAAVKSRKWEDIYGNPEEAFTSCAHIHLGNIAYRLQKSLVFDPAASKFKGDRKATKMLKDNYRKPFVVPEIA